jgi:valyl-tRNA synthetase
LAHWRKFPKNPPVSRIGRWQDRWIQARLLRWFREVDRLFNTYLFGEAGGKSMISCGENLLIWYIEIAKLQLAEGGDRAFYTAQTLDAHPGCLLAIASSLYSFCHRRIMGHLKRACQEHSSLLTPETAGRKH